MELTLAGFTVTLTQLLAAQGLFSGLLLAALAVLCWRQRQLRRELAQTRQHLGLLRTQLEALSARREEEPAGPPAAAPAPFAGTLRQAELQSRLQPAAVHRGAPERYRYVAALAEQGLSPAQIGQALHLAPAEVEQAVRLAQLRRDRRGANENAAAGR